MRDIVTVAVFDRLFNQMIHEVRANIEIDTMDFIRAPVWWRINPAVKMQLMNQLLEDFDDI